MEKEKTEDQKLNNSQELNEKEVFERLHKTEKDLDEWARKEKGYNSYAEWYNDLSM